MFISKLVWREIFQTPFKSFLLNVNFKNLTIGRHILIISFMLAKFQEYQRSIVKSSKTCLYFKFLW